MKTADLRPFSSQRGSVLLVALLFAAIIAISLSSYIKLATRSTQFSYRSHYAGVAMNAAESGLERAMWSINKKRAGATDTVAWTNDGWSAHPTLGGNTACQTFDLGTVAGGASVQVKVFVSDRTLAASAPYAIARSIVDPLEGPDIEKWIKISLYQRSFFSNGLVAKEGITFSGNNASVDSYDSRLGDYNALLADGTRNRYARGSAGSTSVAVDSLSVGNADIYGYASVGTSDYSGLDVGSQGKVTGNFNAAGGTVDYSRVTTSFSASFEPEPAPTIGTNLGTVSNNLTLPEDTTSDVKVLNDDGTYTYYYQATSLNLSNKVLTISPGYDVVVTVSGSVSLSGNSGAISVNSEKTNGVLKNAKLNLYVAGNMDITGQGTTLNTLTTTTGGTSTTSINKPENLMIWGTGGTSQVIKVAGNGSLSAVVYAPNATIEAKGGGNSGAIYGAFVGNRVKMTGNDAFHYDEALKDLDLGSPLGIDQWDEYVTAVDRQAEFSKMNF